MPDLPETTSLAAAQREDEIRRLAYQFWEEEGKPEGRAFVHWDRACLVMMSLLDDQPTDQPVWLQQNAEQSPSASVPAKSDSNVKADINASVEDLRKRVAGKASG